MEGEDHIAVIGLGQQLLDPGDQFPAVRSLQGALAAGGPFDPNEGAGFTKFCQHSEKDQKNKQYS